jgi:hypothetical protein
MQRFSLLLLVGAALIGVAAYGQGKPNYSGTWELTRIERNGMKIPAGKTFKETQIWTHREPKLNIKIMTWEETLGYRTLNLTYDVNGNAGFVGYLVHADGTKEPVNGSAHWDGNRLVYEQEFPNASKGGLSHIIRTSTLTDKGQTLVLQQVDRMAGENQKHEALWFYDKKSGTP